MPAALYSRNWGGSIWFIPVHAKYVLYRGKQPGTPNHCKFDEGCGSWHHRLGLKTG